MSRDTDARLAALELVAVEILQRLFAREELADLAVRLAPPSPGPGRELEQTAHLYAVGLVQSALREPAATAAGVKH